MSQANSADGIQSPETEEGEKNLAKARVHRAREYAMRVKKHKQAVSKGLKPLTVPISPRFSSEARIQYHREVLEPRKKTREEELRRENIRLEKKRQVRVLSQDLHVISRLWEWQTR